MTKYKNKYRVESHRMPNWDYSGNGIYFLTICVNNRLCLFGNVKNDKMILNEYGKIAHDEWKKSFEIRSEIQLDESVIMPNHLHGIVIINNDNKQNNGQLFNRKNRLWQINYHDRIVRNKNEFERIKQYIINNPKNWENDRNNKEGLWI